MTVTLNSNACYTPMMFYPLPPTRVGDPRADAVVVGITFPCVLLLILITLMVTIRYFTLEKLKNLKNTTVQKGVPVMIS